MQESIDAGDFTLRDYAMVESNSCGDAKLCPALYAGYWGDHGAHQLRVRSVKMHLDGALGSFGAVMLEPYTVLPPGYSGDPKGTFKVEAGVFSAAVRAAAAARTQQRQF